MPMLRPSRRLAAFRDACSEFRPWVPAYRPCHPPVIALLNNLLCMTAQAGEAPVPGGTTLHVPRVHACAPDDPVKKCYISYFCPLINVYPKLVRLFGCCCAAISPHFCIVCI